jgi:hypothetical protein
MAAGSPSHCYLGIDLSRGRHDLKIWFTFNANAVETIILTIYRNSAFAHYLAERIAQSPELELLAPVELNIICFRYRGSQSEAQTDDQINTLNAQIAIALQESGSVAPSTTILDGHLTLRAALVNHRTTAAEIDTLIDQTLTLGRRLAAEASVATQPRPPSTLSSASSPPSRPSCSSTQTPPTCSFLRLVCWNASVAPPPLAPTTSRSSTSTPPTSPHSTTSATCS